MQVVPEDVLTGFKGLWDQSPLPALITGGLHHGRAKADATPPYAVMRCEESDREELSGAYYLAKFIVTFRVWDKAGATATYGRETAAAFDRAAEMQIPNAANLIHVRPLAGGLDLAPEPRNAEEVLAVSRRWEVMLGANREVTTQ